MEFKGTKGKWVAEKPKESNGYWYVNTEDFTNGSVATCYCVESGEDTEKNAQLIAAAPELLAALKSCVLSMQAHPDCTEDSEFQAFVNKGWEVIKKATKQQNNPNKPDGFNEWIDKINNHVKKTKL